MAMPIVINDVEWAEDLEKRFELYMDQLAECIDNLDPENSFETLSGEPYCGCNVCYHREIITFISKEVLLAAKSNKIELAD